mmetsp:Transcript_194/g.418  ORF Transcript_194/g.418 Transcript_194/m.418 type:complete len:475 (+) Transcript_194:653-2077(+)
MHRVVVTGAQSMLQFGVRPSLVECAPAFGLLHPALGQAQFVNQKLLGCGGELVEAHVPSDQLVEGGTSRRTARRVQQDVGGPLPESLQLELCRKVGVHAGGRGAVRQLGDTEAQQHPMQQPRQSVVEGCAMPGRVQRAPQRIGGVGVQPEQVEECVARHARRIALARRAAIHAAAVVGWQWGRSQPAVHRALVAIEHGGQRMVRFAAVPQMQAERTQPGQVRAHIAHVSSQQAVHAHQRRGHVSDRAQALPVLKLQCDVFAHLSTAQRLRHQRGEPKVAAADRRRHGSAHAPTTQAGEHALRCGLTARIGGRGRRVSHAAMLRLGQLVLYLTQLQADLAADRALQPAAERSPPCQLLSVRVAWWRRRGRVCALLRIGLHTDVKVGLVRTIAVAVLSSGLLIREFVGLTASLHARERAATFDAAPESAHQLPDQQRVVKLLARRRGERGVLKKGARALRRLVDVAVDVVHGKEWQ